MGGRQGHGSLTRWIHEEPDGSGPAEMSLSRPINQSPVNRAWSMLTLANVQRSCQFCDDDDGVADDEKRDVRGSNEGLERILRLFLLEAWQFKQARTDCSLMVHQKVVETRNSFRYPLEAFQEKQIIVKNPAYTDENDLETFKLNSIKNRQLHVTKTYL
uniref:Uncharacterized protein n=1 Tax=Romanomermis culicivorax TaxID=13658 RepID=A0A915IP73_ROMCU